MSPLKNTPPSLENADQGLPLSTVSQIEQQIRDIAALVCEDSLSREQVELLIDALRKKLLSNVKAVSHKHSIAMGDNRE